MAPHEIKSWLRDIGKDREWLARECGVAKSTVDGWLSVGSQRPIPGPALRVIEGLRNNISLNPVIDLATYLAAQKLAEQKGLTIEKWVGELVREAVEPVTMSKAGEEGK